MSIKIMAQVWDLECESCTQKLVLIALADNSNDQAVCWPSLETLAKKCCLGLNAVRRQVNRLNEIGWIELEKGGGRNSHRYTLTLPLGDPSPKGTPPSPGGVTSLPGMAALPARDPNRKQTIIEPSKRQPAEFAVVPEPLSTSNEFLDAWKLWIEYRKKTGKKIVETTQAAQLEMLKRWGVEKAIQSIQKSIQSGWQGLFEPKTDFRRPVTAPNHEGGF